MARFTVDTHLFRELGELLVGRDSTALVELIKNSYDADATEVTVWGSDLDKAARGKIVITDNGTGMTPAIFKTGFLRIASRLKETGNRRSPYYKRSYTGAKGVGRLAAQKLAWHLKIASIPDPEVHGDDAEGVRATIDWAKIDSCETLDDQGVDAAVTVEAKDFDDTPGTQIELTKLRGRWTPKERSRVIQEVTTFRPPQILLSIPKTIRTQNLLFDEILLRDVGNVDDDPGFNILLAGDFDVGEEYWAVVTQAADWILEIKADGKKKVVNYLLTPTRALLRKLPDASQHAFDWEPEALDPMPSMNARVLIREGSEGIKQSHRRWLGSTAGVRVYMEGFRVLPYGDSGDDWLEIDFDYTQRARTLRYLDEAEFDLQRFGDEDKNAPLSALRNSSYFGAVFLTRHGTPELEMLVNREGFIPNAAYFALHKIVRTGIDLSVRARAFENRHRRDDRRQRRSDSTNSKGDAPPQRLQVREAAEEAAQKATRLASEARAAAASGEHKRAEQLITTAVRELEKSTGLAGELITDRSIMQVLAGVGLQMSAFVHEMNALLGMASAVEGTIHSIRDKITGDQIVRRELARLEQSVGDLRRLVERQASYLADVTSPDARRRRSRQKLSERFDASVGLVSRAAEKRGIAIENRIPDELRSTAMFPAEITVIFSNLLSNAIKAAGKPGTVRASGKHRPSGDVSVVIQNTGRRVRLTESEKWFLPFKSTTVEADPVLGQGMGMGLPIVRNILEEYGATIRFVPPTGDFSTAIEMTFS